MLPNTWGQREDEETVHRDHPIALGHPSSRAFPTYVPKDSWVVSPRMVGSVGAGGQGVAGAGGSVVSSRLDKGTAVVARCEAL